MDINIQKQLIGTIIGLVLVTIGIVFSLKWWDSVMVIARGLLGVVIVLAGALFIGLSRR